MGLQPNSGTDAALESGYLLRSLFKPNDEACMPLTREYIIHIVYYIRYDYTKKLMKELQGRSQFSVTGIYLAFLATKMKR